MDIQAKIRAAEAKRPTQGSVSEAWRGQIDIARMLKAQAETTVHAALVRATFRVPGTNTEFAVTAPPGSIIEPISVMGIDNGSNVRVLKNGAVQMTRFDQNGIGVPQIIAHAQVKSTRTVSPRLRSVSEFATGRSFSTKSNSRSTWKQPWTTLSSAKQQTTATGTVTFNMGDIEQKIRDVQEALEVAQAKADVGISAQPSHYSRKEVTKRSGAAN